MLHDDGSAKPLGPILDWLEQVLHHVEPAQGDARSFALGRAQVQGLLAELRAAADSGELALGIARGGFGFGHGPVLVLLGEDGAVVAMRPAPVGGGREPQE